MEPIKKAARGNEKMARLRAGLARAKDALRTVRNGAAASAAISDKRLQSSELDLKRHHRILDVFFENSVTPLVLLDRDLNFIRVNEAYARCSHRRASDFPGHNHFEFHPSEFRPKFAQVVHSRQPYRAMATLFFGPNHPEEGATYWNLHCAPVLGEAGRVECLVVAFEDVTGHKHAETRLKAMNALLGLFASKATRKSYLDGGIELLSTLSNCAAVGIRMLNTRGEIPYESFCGFNEEFLKSECWLSVYKDQCACTRVVLGQPDPQDKSMMTPSGSFVCNNTLEFVGRLTESQKARFRGVCVQQGFKTVAVIPVRYGSQAFGAIHLADKRPNRLDRVLVESLETMAPLIGEAVYRFDVEEALRQSETRYRRIVETATEGIWIVDREGQTTFVNRRMAAMLGYSALEMLGRPLDSFMDPALRAAAQFALERRREGIAEQHDLKFRRKDGTEVWAFFSTTPIYDEAGQYDGALAMVADITERRRLEHEVLSAGDETSRRIGQDLHDSLGQLLVGLTFQSRELERKLVAQSAEDAAEAARIAKAAKEAATLARTLAHGLCPVQVTPGGLMAALRDLARRTATTYGIACTFTARVSLVMHDTVAASHVYQIVQEALTNAVTHGKARRVSISVTPADGRVALRVRDNGRGMPKERVEDKGLGLRTMRYRAGMIGASIEIAPAPKGGTVITCWLPAGGSQEPGKMPARPPRRAAKRT